MFYNILLRNNKCNVCLISEEHGTKIAEINEKTATVERVLNTITQDFQAQKANKITKETTEGKEY